VDGAMTALRSTVKRVVLNTGLKILGGKKFGNLLVRFNRGLNLDLNSTRLKQLDLYQGASEISTESWYSAVMDAFYNDKDPNLIVAGPQIASEASFVPYYKGFTNLIVFNFFRNNYNLRSPIIYRYSIFKNDQIVWCRQYILKSNQVLLIKDPSIYEKELPENGSLVLEAFHPRMSIRTKQLRYFVIYRDEDNGVVSGCHSLALGERFLGLIQPSYRAFGVEGLECYYHSTIFNRKSLMPSSDPGSLKKLVSDQLVSLGYLVHEHAGMCPSAVWHDGPSPHYSVESKNKKKLGSSFTVFLIPDFQKYAPRVLISSSQIGFLPAFVTIHLTNESGELDVKKKHEVERDNTTLDILQEFEEMGISGPVNVKLEFDRDVGDFAGLPVGYVHLYYRDPNGAGDQVHSHSTFGYYDFPYKGYKSYRCRKFAPYFKKFNCIYSIVNTTLGLKPTRDDEIKIRLFTDQGQEKLFRKKLSGTGVTNIEGHEIFSDHDLDIKDIAIVQFEHETTNFQCSWFLIDKVSGSLAVDHFTGG
jgi:hypothetical protein